MPDFDDFRALVMGSRSCRRFRQDRPVTMAELTALAELARFCPSAANLQPLKLILASSPETCARIFPALGWAAYLTGWRGPAEGERPTGYVIILHDTELAKNPHCDHGILAQTVCLGAAAMGFSACMIASMDKKALRAAFALPERYELLLVLALGTRGEECVVEDVGEGDNIRYWRDPAGMHHVPKRTLAELVLARYPSSDLPPTTESGISM
jgi:nitroreductase